MQKHRFGIAGWFYSVGYKQRREGLYPHPTSYLIAMEKLLTKWPHGGIDSCLNAMRMAKHNLNISGGGLSPHKVAVVLGPLLGIGRHKAIDKMAYTTIVVDRVFELGLNKLSEGKEEPEFLLQQRARTAKKQTRAKKASQRAAHSVSALAVVTGTPTVAHKKAFYESWEWTTLRMQILKRFGRTCMCCGANGGNGVVIHVDHIKPLSKYWELRLDADNLQVLCNTCNKGKGAWDETDYRPPAPDLSRSNLN